jgi:hypothetical protein
MDTPTWATVTTAAEPKALLLAFVAHHLEAGASEVFIYLDRPNPAFAALVAPLEQVHVFDASEGGWPALHGKKKRAIGSREVVRRQIANARHAQTLAKSDWLFHVDVDEFIVNTPQLGQFLSGLPEEVWGVVLPVAERVFEGADEDATVFGGSFRTRIDKEGLVEKVYGDTARFLKKGLAGHSLGKAGVRIGTPAQLRLHTVDLPEGEDEQARKRRFDTVGMLHFDAWSYESWHAKMQRLHGKPLGSPERAVLVEAVATGNTGHTPREIFGQIYELSPEQVKALDKAGRLYRQDFAIDDKIRQVFPDVSVDLSKAGVARLHKGLW